MALSTRLFLIFFLSLALHAQDAAPATDEPPKDRSTLLQLQIFLDRHLFCPGKLDGALGEFTFKALVNYNFANRRRNLYEWSYALEQAAKEVPVMYATYQIKEEMLRFVDPALPEKPEEQATFPYMAYRSLAELVAERFHTDEDFLAKLNPDKNMTRLKPGDRVIVPNVRSFRIEEVKPMASYKADPLLSKNTIVIDTTERIAVVYAPDERLLAAFPITPGKPEFIPVGTWEMKTILTTPSFRYDKQFLEAGVRGGEAYQLPPGPNSPVGIIWCGISKSGIGLHGTALPRTIGRSQSAGCVRFANWDAIRLPTLVRPGSQVIVR
ncbi:MAG: L,D-transpeptidase [Prosthecobacter sp.]|nr:L,D-transpeptidase [Prosthecobacter sp.]